MDIGSLFTWQNITLLLGGVVGAKVIAWIAGWVDGKGLEFIKSELEALRKKSNENSILGQISADDAVIDTLEHALPVVLHTLEQDVQDALASGDLSKVDWKKIGTDLWAQAKGQVQGGANDYLKNSSFADGEAVAAMVAQRFFAAQKAQKDGLITDAPREATPPAAPSA